MEEIVTIGQKTPTPSILGVDCVGGGDNNQEVDNNQINNINNANHHLNEDQCIEESTNLNTNMNMNMSLNLYESTKDLSLIQMPRYSPHPRQQHPPQHIQHNSIQRQHHHQQQQQQQLQQPILISCPGGLQTPNLIDPPPALGLSHMKPPRSNITLPSNLAYSLGLAQVFVGGAMVITGSFALRYQSYLFYYGSGLWAGTLAGIAGILAVMATKQGLPKPKWLCGGRRWQIQVFLAAVMLALSTAILTAIFSTSGLVRDTQRDFSKNVNNMTPDEEMFEKRKSAGIAINAILLFLALLQILLSFCSLGIALRVLCSNPYSHNGSLLSSGSEGSEVTVREILGNGTGPEYEARKDRLLRWLGHQRRNFFMSQQPKGVGKAASIHSASKLGVNHMDPRFYSFVAVPPHMNMNMHPHASLPFVIPANYPPAPRTIFSHAPPGVGVGPHSLPSPYVSIPYPQPLMVPIIPLPTRQPRSNTPNSLTPSSEKRRRRRGHSASGSSVGGKSGKTRRSSSVPRSKRSEEKNKEVEITEEEVKRTYTGLDRQVAESFISNSFLKND